MDVSTNLTVAIFSQHIHIQGVTQYSVKLHNVLYIYIYMSVRGKKGKKPDALTTLNDYKLVNLD